MSTARRANTPSSKARAGRSGFGTSRPPDSVLNPPHYTRLRPEPLDVIEAWGLGFHLGNVLKYVARAGHKGDEIEDLRKAVNYLERRIAMVERQ